MNHNQVQKQVLTVCSLKELIKITKPGMMLKSSISIKYYKNRHLINRMVVTKMLDIKKNL